MGLGPGLGSNGSSKFFSSPNGQKGVELIDGTEATIIIDSDRTQFNEFEITSSSTSYLFEDKLLYWLCNFEIPFL